MNTDWVPTSLVNSVVSGIKGASNFLFYSINYCFMLYTFDANCATLQKNLAVNGEFQNI